MVADDADLLEDEVKGEIVKSLSQCSKGNEKKESENKDDEKELNEWESKVRVCSFEIFELVRKKIPVSV